MKEQVFKHPRRILLLWGCTLLLLMALSLGAHHVLGRHVQAMREADPDSYLVAAEALMSRHDFPKAEAQILLALQRDPENPKTFKTKGDLHFNQKQWRLALEAYQLALKFHNQAPGIRSNTLWALIELEHYEEATTFGKRCIDAGDTMPIIPRYTAEALVRNEQWQEAIPFLENAIAFYTRDMYLLNLLHQAYKKNGDTEKAQGIKDQITAMQTNLVQESQ
jgi:tetratricopeptide (TPR) repeat protein